MEDPPPRGIQLAKTCSVAVELAAVRVPLPVVLHAESTLRPGEIDTAHEEPVHEDAELRNRNRKAGL